MIALVRRGDSGGGKYPDVDLSTVKFPSDDLTIRMLRQIHRESFDVISDKEWEQPKFFFKPTHHDHVDSTLAAMLYLERLLAANAYAVAASGKGIDFGMGDDDAREELTELYVRYRLASGPHHAAELIRAVEQQAAALAKQREP